MIDETFHLTPLDARRFEFGRSMRGYDKARVEEFRQQVADERVLRSTFAGARAALAAVRAAGHADASELSMGMSGDYEIAVEEGATIVRLGTVLFGARAT